MLEPSLVDFLPATGCQPIKLDIPQLGANARG
jgi:hypothetical protein